MNRRYLRVFIAFTILASAIATGSAAKPVDAGAAADEHRRIVDFWTKDRVSRAVPREFTRTSPGNYALTPNRERPPRPGRGVTGASWTGGGTLADSTGKVLFAMAGVYYVCSASVVTDTATNRSVVLTAAHCVYDEAAGAFATNWMFIPNYDAAPADLTTNGSFCSATLYGCWTASSLIAHRGYTTAGGFNDTAVVYDFAFAVLGEGGKANTLVENIVGSQAIAFTDNAANVMVDAFGYPAAGRYNGTDLVYCEGPTGFDALVGNATYRIGCNMTGGSSGGPWMRDLNKSTGQGTLTSVNSYGYSRDRSMYGPKFNSDTADLYGAALTATNNTVVP